MALLMAGPIAATLRSRSARCSGVMALVSRCITTVGCGPLGLVFGSHVMDQGAPPAGPPGGRGGEGGGAGGAGGGGTSGTASRRGRSADEDACLSRRTRGRAGATAGTAAAALAGAAA